MKDINQKYTGERISPSDGADGETPGRVEAQTESGELVITPGGDIANVAAKKKHSEMDESEVTDVLEEGSYVLSHAEDGSMNITREEAEAEIFGQGVSVYRENGISVPGKQTTLADFFPKGVDEMTPADLGRRIRAAYPMSQQDDVYAKKSNSMNKTNREAAVLALVKLNEKKRLDKEGPDEVIEESSLDVPTFAPGGAVGSYLSNVLLGNPPGSVHGYMDTVGDINQAVQNQYGGLENFFPQGTFDNNQSSGITKVDGVIPVTGVSPNSLVTDDGGISGDVVNTRGGELDWLNPLDSQAQRADVAPTEKLMSKITEVTPASTTKATTSSTDATADGDWDGLKTDLEKMFSERQKGLDDQLDKVRQDYTDFMNESTENARTRSKNSLKEYLEQVEHANRVFDRQSAVGFMGNIAINAAQDPRVDAVDYIDQINSVKSELDRTPEFLKEYQSKGLAAQNRNNAKSMFDNTAQFNRAASNMSAMNAQAMNALSDIAVANNKQEIAQFNDKASRIGGLRSAQSLADANQANSSRANLNQKIAAYGNSLENYLGELKMGDLMSNNAEMKARNAMNAAESEYQTRVEYMKLRGASDEMRNLYSQKAQNERELAAFQNRFDPRSANYEDVREVEVKGDNVLGASQIGASLGVGVTGAKASMYNPYANIRNGSELYPDGTIPKAVAEATQNDQATGYLSTGALPSSLKDDNFGIAYNPALTFTNELAGNINPNATKYPSLFTDRQSAELFPEQEIDAGDFDYNKKYKFI